MKFYAFDRYYLEVTHGDIAPTVSKRWWSRDPKAASFPGWSPYNSFLNNPINNIDPGGDSVWINTGKINYDKYGVIIQDESYYQNRVLYVSGSLYKLFLTKNSFEYNAYSALNFLYDGSADAKEVIETMMFSEKNFVIYNAKTPTKGSSAAVESTNDKNTMNCYSHNLINKNGNVSKDGVFSLSHELFHGYQFVNNIDYYSVNAEVNAYLFSDIVGMNLSLITSPLLEGKDNSQKGLLFSGASNRLLNKGFNIKDYRFVVNNFLKLGYVNRNGLYSKKKASFETYTNDNNPLIKRFLIGGRILK